MNTDKILFQLEHHVTAYDRRQSRSKYYNPFALGIYLERCHCVVESISNGASLADALEANFNDRLLAYLQKRVKN